jgi:hypothetical protein
MRHVASQINHPNHLKSFTVVSRALFSSLSLSAVIMPKETATSGSHKSVSGINACSSVVATPKLEIKSLAFTTCSVILI